MVLRTAVWPYKVNTYDLFRVICENPRIEKKEISRMFKVNEKTGLNWWNKAVSRGIIRLPIFRRDSFLNFREYFYFLNVKDPHELYLQLQKNKDLMFYSVQTGFSNFQIVSRKEIDPPGDVVLGGERTDYFVSIPRDCTFQTSISLIRNKLSKIGSLNFPPSPLIYHDEIFQQWDGLMEQIYQKFFNDFRRPIREILRTTDAYSDKIMEWIRSRDKFGCTIVMYFPEGLASYQPTTFCIETEYDSLLIDLFSQLPVSSLFYRIRDKLIVKLYLPFSLEGRQIARETLSNLRKKELVGDYTNSIDEYYYCPGV